jgi:DNA repair exonuclease SbcCD ATPase subunit
MKKYFDWTDETGITTCRMCGKEGEFIGESYCHLEDYDFKSKLTGGFIAEMRAEIAYLKHKRDNQLKPAINELTHLLSILESKKDRSPEVEQIIHRELRHKQSELRDTRDHIKELREGLSNYLTAKEEYHQKLRRAKKIKEQENKVNSSKE